MAKGTLRSRVPVFREHVRRGLTAGEAGIGDITTAAFAGDEHITSWR
jgi:hypothetical protein